MTVNGQHIISEVISTCGGINIFGELNTLAPTVSVEPVLAANPQVIIAGDNMKGRLEEWNHWPELAAVQFNNLYLVNWDLINRHSPRILDGVRRVCEALEQARSNIRAKTE
jgi:iron complex transport system substrate-binding protein